MSERPLYVQSDLSIFLETSSPAYADARDCLARFAELEKSPEHIHTYRITPLSLYNAAAIGVTAAGILEDLERFSKTGVPQNVTAEIESRIERYGLLRLIKSEDGEALVLETDEPELLTEVLRSKLVQPLLASSALTDIEDHGGEVKSVRVDPLHRGRIKQVLLKLGYPADDLAGYRDGEALDITLREETLAGQEFAVRHYQEDAAGAFWAGGTERGGNGVVVLPCGAGKTIVAIKVMQLAQRRTLILSTNLVAVRQWRREILDKTNLAEEQVQEYTGESKALGDVTLSTYQLLTYRKSKTAPYEHLKIFLEQDWGLIVYDEVHLLPAPVFRMTAEVQAMRRLGLTATLVREDGREDDVFTLIGPKRFDVPWKELERQGWIAEVECCEVRLALAAEMKSRYAVGSRHDQIRIAAENPSKLMMLREIVAHHQPKGDLVLVIGQYLDQVEMASKLLDAPLITGKTANRQREELYAAFRNREIPVLVVSKVGNFAIDLPDANVAVQVSGTFGSRQEEAQRLGRVLRPKADGSRARFYSLVTRSTREQDFASKRQRFLTEQGYQYQIIDEEAFDPAALGDLCRTTA